MEEINGLIEEFDNALLSKWCNEDDIYGFKDYSDNLCSEAYDRLRNKLCDDALIDMIYDLMSEPTSDNNTVLHWNLDGNKLLVYIGDNEFTIMSK